MAEPRRYLVIDGGGTKTTALLAVVHPAQSQSTASPERVSWSRGEAGPSNLTAGLGPCLAAITSACATALTLSLTQPTSHTSPPANDPSPAPRPPFNTVHCVWAGIAGCARPPDHALLLPHIEGLFPLAAAAGAGTRAGLRLTNDAELLTAPVAESARANPGVRRCVTLVCGTGSLALAWSLASDQASQASGSDIRTDTAASTEAGPAGTVRGIDDTIPRYRQDARSGGWGPLLGDEGSGFALGKAALRDLLTRHANGLPLSAWHADLLRLFGTEDPGALIRRVSALDTALPHAEADTKRKGRIAQCSRAVVGGAERGDKAAKAVVRKVAGEVVQLLRPLVDYIGRQGGGEGEGKGEGEGEGLGQTVLVVGGGLGMQDVFWKEVERGMEAEGWAWAGVERVGDTAQRAMEALLSVTEETSGEATP